MSTRKWRVVSLIADAVLINLGIICAFLLRFSGALPPFNFNAYTQLALSITIIGLAALYIYDLYDYEKTGNSWDVLSAVSKAVTLGVLLTVFLSFFLGFFSFPRAVFLIAWLTQIAFLTGWRIFGARVLKIKWPAQRVLIVGTGEAAREIMGELKRRSEWGYEVVGLTDSDGSKTGDRINDVEVLGGVHSIVDLVNIHEVDRVIVASPTHHREVVEELARAAEGVVVEVIPDLYEIYIGRLDHNLISDIPLVQLNNEAAPDWVRFSKGLADRVLAILALIMASPVMAVAALAIKLTSPGPVIYRQERVGQCEKLFSVYKFRTMVDGAEKLTGPALASQNDNRITPVGQFLRKTRIDEFPQLMNVVRGEMSFVGPRPERLFFVGRFKAEIPGYAERFKVKPGLTGLAQVNGGYATNARNKLKYDLIYLHHQSIFLDFKIMLKTIKVLLTGRGAR
ncbi:MAG: exopolysaccharide biosynthesis polyprenyl glycosylphosphotransferase [Chloroflexi bacterium]|nr:exopolysaccharide biosynthesis polyprenyl glycosylphosphotransferase [Chloroflexota bacterium]